jgi:hypothetical protein
MTFIDRKAFFRLKAAMHDLIDRAGGIERAAEICGYSKSAAGRWHCRHAEDFMPLGAILTLEAETGSALVTRAMAGLNGLECTAAAPGEAHVMGAYVQLTAATAALNAEVAAAVQDGVLTPGEQTRIDQAASAVDASTECLRGSIAAAKQQPVRIVG